MQEFGVLVLPTALAGCGWSLTVSGKFRAVFPSSSFRLLSGGRNCYSRLFFPEEVQARAQRQRRSLVEIFNVSIVAQSLQVIVSLFWSSLDSHRFANLVFVKGGRVAPGRSLIHPKDLITVIAMKGLAHAANRYVLNRRRNVFAQIRDFKPSYFSLVLRCRPAHRSARAPNLPPPASQNPRPRVTVVINSSARAFTSASFLPAELKNISEMSD